MIAQLVRMARREGLKPAAPIRHARGTLVELSTGEVQNGVTVPYFPIQRSGTRHVPGYLSEKAKNLTGTKREMAIDRWREWESVTPIASAAVRYLKIGGGFGSAKDEEWVVFALDGIPATGDDDFARFVLTHPGMTDVSSDIAVCHSCGVRGPVVAGFWGLNISPSVPVLTTWNRGPCVEWGGHSHTSAPTCPECMMLAATWLNAHTQDRRVEIGGMSWEFDDGNRSASVAHINDPLDDLWRDVVRWSMDTDKKAHPNGSRWLPQMDDPSYLTGYVYGVCEWLSGVVGCCRIPYLRDAALAPLATIGQIVTELQRGVTCYTAQKDEGGRVGPKPRIVREWYDHTLKALSGSMASLGGRSIAGPEQGLMALGYAHALSVRGRSRSALAGRTPWEKALAEALERAGMPAQEQYRVERAGGSYYMLDLAYPDVRLCIEIDGRLSGPYTRDHDADSVRSGELMAMGWHIWRVPNRRISKDCAAVVRQIVCIVEKLKNQETK